MVTNNARQKLTPPQYAKRLGVSASKVTDWIKSGELHAINVSNGNTRPRFLIDLDDIKAFEDRRAVGSPSPTRRIPRQRRNGNVKDFV